ncbi:MAG: ABC transporter substrate-binding protein [Candidatus Thorarchaeota archaeon]
MMHSEGRHAAYAAVAILLVLALCTNIKGVSAYQPALDFRWEGNLDSIGLDPHVNNEKVATWILSNIYETLYAYPFGSSNTSHLVPLLAAELPEVSSDGLNYTINLRQGIEFHDQTPFNASCVKWNIERTIKIFDLDGPAKILASTLTGGTALLEAARNSGPSSSSFVSAFDNWISSSDSIEILDTYRIRFVLAEPFSPFIQILAHLGCSAISPSYVLEKSNSDTGPMMTHWGVEYGRGDPWMDTHTCGTGPYMFREWRPEFLLLEKSLDYWRADITEASIAPSNYAGHFQSLVFEPKENDNASMLNLQSGFVDSVDWPLAYADEIWDSTELSSKETHINVSTNGMNFDLSAVIFRFTELNITRGGVIKEIMNPCAHREFRKCLAFAFDYQASINANLNGWGYQASGFIPQEMFGQDASHWDQSYDIDNAVFWWNLAMQNSTFVAAINALKGYLDLNFISGDSTSLNNWQLIGSGLSAVMSHGNTNLTGIELVPQVRIIELSDAIYIEKMNNGEAPMWLIEWSPILADPHDSAWSFVHSQGAFMTTSGYSNDTIDQWIEAASKTTNRTLRRELYGQIQEQVAHDQPGIYLYQTKQFAVHGTWLKGRGLEFNPMHDIYLYEVNEDYSVVKPDPTDLFTSPLVSIIDFQLTIISIFLITSISQRERTGKVRGFLFVMFTIMLIVMALELSIGPAQAGSQKLANALSNAAFVISPFLPFFVIISVLMCLDIVSKKDTGKAMIAIALIMALVMGVLIPSIYWGQPTALPYNIIYWWGPLILFTLVLICMAVYVMCFSFERLSTKKR